MGIKCYKSKKFSSLAYLIALSGSFTISHAWALNAVNAKAHNNELHVVFQETIEVKGVVQEADATGNLVSVPNATIIIKETNVSTKADAKGNFIVRMKSGQTLVFRALGHQQKQIKISAANSNLKVVLESNASDLDEVVVTGFQTIKKSQFTGATTKLFGDDIKIQGQVDVSRMLEGRAAGVSIQNVSGTFGSAPKLRIRGATSLTGDNKPLWVVDGVVLEDVVNISNDQLSSGDPATLIGSAVAGINANDIESIDILKDAEATGLYGARAMNGVVVINTRRGKTGAFNINYSGTFSTQLKPNYDNYNIMNSVDQIAFNNEIYNKGGFNYSDVINGNSWGPYGKMYSLIETYNATSGKFGLENTPEARHVYLQKQALNNTDWFDLLFKNQLIQEHNISLTSGSEKVRTYASLSYYGDNGWTVADKVNRATFNFRNDYTVNDRLNLGLIGVVSYRDQKAPGTINRVNNAVEGMVSRDFDINPFQFALNTSRAMAAFEDDGSLAYYNRNYAPFNILHELQNNFMKIGALDAKLQGSIDYKIIKPKNPDDFNLNYNFIGAGRIVRTSNETIVTEYSNVAEAWRAAPNTIIRNANRFLFTDPENPNELPQIVLPEGGFYNRFENSLRSYDVRQSLTFSKKVNSRLSTNGLIGQQVRFSERQEFTNVGAGFQYDKGGVPFVVPNYFKKTLQQNNFYYSMQPSNEKYASFYATVSASYDEKYNFKANVRYDGGNLLGRSAQARWLPTWSLGGSWNFTEEKFMKPAKKVLTSGKLRASFGLVASLGRASNALPVFYSQNTIRPYIDEKETVLGISQLENSQITWEKAYSPNLGLDLTFLNGRVSLITDVYQRRNFDLISFTRVSGIGGQFTKQANVANMGNRGIEFTVNVVPVKTTDWNWSMNFNFAHNQTKITKAGNNPNIFSLIRPEGGILQGYPVRSLFAIDFKGLQANSGVPEFTNERGQTALSVYFQSQDVKYLKYMGPVDPTTTGGFSNTVTWKNLTFSALITFQTGNKILLDPAFSPFYSDFVATPNDFKDRFVLPGDNQFTTIPAVVDPLNRSRFGRDYPYSVYNYSTDRVADGSFARLKSMQISYNFPKRILEKAKIGSAALSLTGSNMFLLYSDKKLRGQDPEFFNSGGVAQPLAKMYALTLRIGF